MDEGNQAVSADPYLLLTAIHNGSARLAALTRSHADAMERALGAVGSFSISGLDLIELPLPPQAFDALRLCFNEAAHTVGLYDLFALPPTTAPKVRLVAGQFLAAEMLWKLESSGMLKGAPLTITFTLPKKWDRDPMKIRQRLIDEGALEISDSAAATYKQIKAAWDAPSKPGSSST